MILGIKANTQYDLVHGMPAIIERDGDGSHLCRMNIEPVYEDGKQTAWACYEIRFWESPTKDNLKRLLIRSIISESQEMKLINDYNRHQLGIRESAEAVARYRDFLQMVEEIDKELEML